jgi:transcriptional regulator with XRE-family HTH domain
MEGNTSFGYWVRRRRKALDLTQEELARQVGCSPVTIRKIEAIAMALQPPNLTVDQHGATRNPTDAPDVS